MLGALARVREPVARAIVFGFVGTVGIAHGATDVDAVERIGVRAFGGRPTLSIGYGVLALATFLSARRFPRLGARALLGLSVWHFGSGDVAFANACGQPVRGSRARGYPETLVRGGLPLFVRGARERTSLAALAIACVRIVEHLVRGRYADALDVGIPAALLGCIPSRLGFGIYFGAWHSIRHTALLLERDTRLGSERERAVRFARESAPNVLIAVLAGAVAYALDARRLRRTALAAQNGGSPAGARRSEAESERRNEDAFGALILAITVPHQIAVTVLERHAAAANEPRGVARDIA